MLFPLKSPVLMTPTAVLRAVPRCLIAWLAVSAVAVWGNERDFDPTNAPPSYPLQITSDGREVMYEAYANYSEYDDSQNLTQIDNDLWQPNDPWPTAGQPIRYRGQTAPETSRVGYWPKWPGTAIFSSDFWWSPKSDGVRFSEQEADATGGPRPSMLQGMSLAASYLPGLGSRGLEMTQVRVGASLGLPGPLQDSFILVSPSFEPTFVNWDGPEPFPNTFYTASLNAMLIKQCNERWSAMFSAGPRWSSDGRETQGAVRCSLMGGMIWNKSPRLQIQFGVAYLDRSDSFNVLPFGGLVWKPNDDWKYELMAPMLRVARRCYGFQAILPREAAATHWAYVGIGFGGGSWAFQSVGKRPDVADYSEYSVVVGLESQRGPRNAWKTEFGYVFGRKMEFEKDTMHRLHIDDSLVFRVTLSM